MQMMSKVISTGTTSIKLSLSSIFSLTMLRCPSGMYGGSGRLPKGFIPGQVIASLSRLPADVRLIQKIVGIINPIQPPLSLGVFIQGEANPYGRGRSNVEWDEDDGRKYTQINQSFPPLALGLHVHYIPPPLSIVFSTP